MILWHLDFSARRTWGLLCLSLWTLPAAVHGQTRTWTSTMPGDFLIGSNWSGGVAPNRHGPRRRHLHPAGQ